MRNVGNESSKTYVARMSNGFMEKYLSGQHILEIGPGPEAIVAQAIAIGPGYPGYNGTVLPFNDQSQDAVYSSHCLEHVTDSAASLREWFRVLRVGGFLVITVPHYQLYEKKVEMPSRFSGEHKRFYHAGRLLMELYDNLPKGEWRLRHCLDNDQGFDYSLPVAQHSIGCYEVEVVVERIARPGYINEMYPT